MFCAECLYTFYSKVWNFFFLILKSYQFIVIVTNGQICLVTGHFQRKWDRIFEIEIHHENFFFRQDFKELGFNFYPWIAINSSRFCHT